MSRQPKRRASTRRAVAVGDEVTVFRFDETGRPSIEGVATIVGRERGPFHRVRFKGEHRDCWRLVHGGPWQSEPERLLSELEEQWLLSLTPELLTEFFPHDMRDREDRS